MLALSPSPKQGILEGIADIEARAYRLLAEKGATPVKAVYTAGEAAASDEAAAVVEACLRWRLAGGWCVRRCA